MSNVIVESLFLAACFAPPLAVVFGVLLLIGRTPAWHQKVAQTPVPAHR